LGLGRAGVGAGAGFAAGRHEATAMPARASDRRRMRIEILGGIWKETDRSPDLTTRRRGAVERRDERRGKQRLGKRDG
jgi:hypothetical protein